jgi:hypothetical protein
MSIKEEVESELNALKGLGLWACGRAADLQWLQFGAKHTVHKWPNGTKEVGDYALHIQCAWRFRGPNGIVVGSRDRYYPKGDNAVAEEGFEWDLPGGNRCDERIEMFQREYFPLNVVGVTADDSGGFILALNSGFFFDVFPDDSLNEELWRLFEPSTENPHFVFEGNASRNE